MLILFQEKVLKHDLYWLEYRRGIQLQQLRQWSFSAQRERCILSSCKQKEAGPAAFIQLNAGCYCLLVALTQVGLGCLERHKWCFIYMAFLNTFELKMQNLTCGLHMAPNFSDIWVKVLISGGITYLGASALKFWSGCRTTSIFWIHHQVWILSDSFQSSHVLTSNLVLQEIFFPWKVENHANNHTIFQKPAPLKYLTFSTWEFGGERWL